MAENLATTSYRGVLARKLTHKMPQDSSGSVYVMVAWNIIQELKRVRLLLTTSGGFNQTVGQFS